MVYSYNEASLRLLSSKRSEVVVPAFFPSRLIAYWAAPSTSVHPNDAVLALTA